MFLNASKRCIKSGIGFECSTVKLTIWLLVVCTVGTLVTSQQHFYTHGRYGKRGDPREASSFWAGSRYGRSGDSVSSGSMNEDKSEIRTIDVEVSPRMDRFFLGSRYGKRTVSNDQTIDYLKHIEETSLDFLISVDPFQTISDKERLKILNQELKDNDNFVATKSHNNDDDDNDYDNNNNNNNSEIMKSYGSFSDNGFVCIHTGITNLYRCFHRKSNGTVGSSN